MPPTPATVTIHAPRARSHQHNRFIRTMLYVLLFALLTCLSEQFHAADPPYGHLAAESSEVPSLPDSSEGESLDVSDTPDRCHDTGSGPVAFSKSSARVSAPATAATSLNDAADRLSHDPRGAARGLPPSGGRPALVSLCQWRI
ncbi:hypothetical protein ACFZBZ_01880 [Streptomyces sp. NPDC008196]|uniref:hypothetical protein n=1 Tax=Streptomyces sp. NPDC008196 TaxID=3364819 RepID=UPI0036F18CD3